MTLPDWSESSVGEMIEFIGGAQPPRSTFRHTPSEGYIRLIQIRDYKTDKYLTFIPHSMARKFCAKDDIMVGRYGPPLFQILRGLEGAYNVALIKAIPKAGLDREYMYHFLRQDPLRITLEHLSQRTGGQSGIEMDVLLEYPLPLPPTHEQHKIAEILTCWDKAIDLVERLIEEKVLLLKGLTQQLITGGMRLPGHVKDRSYAVGAFGKYPRDWKLMRLNDFLTSMERPVPKPSIPYRRLGLRNRGQGTFISVVEPEKVAMDTLYRIVPNELIVNITFAWEGAITLTGADDDGALVSHRFPTYKIDDAYILPTYLRYVTMTSRFTYHLGLVSPGGAGRNRVMSKRDFLLIEIPVPSVEEQVKIASILSGIEREEKLLRQFLRQIADQKRGLMQKLLTGKIRVKV